MCTSLPLHSLTTYLIPCVTKGGVYVARRAVTSSGSKFSTTSSAPYLARPYVDIRNPKDGTPASWMSAPQTRYSKVLFAKSIAAHPVLVAQTIHKMPSTGIPQIAFVGKSNAGKSTLVNGLMYGKEVARTSATPGRTRQLFTFDLADHLSLIDLPGYGGARVSKEMRIEWAILIDEFFNQSRMLSRVISLIDGKEGLQEIDEKLWAMLTEKEIRFQVVITKADRLSPTDLHEEMLRIIMALETRDPDYVWPFIHCVSAKHNMGMEELRASLSTVASDNRIKAGKRLLKASDLPNRG